jgi:hypothetical protein
MNTVVEMTPDQKPRRNLPAVASPMDIVQAAAKSGNVEMYREAIAMAKELDAFAARKAFENAMADAKAKIPVIKKNRAVDFTSAKGRTNYKFEDLAEIARTVDPILGEQGLSYRFRVSSKPNEPVTVTCVISHRDGHFEETTLCAGKDESGNKNSIQAIGSTVTYLQRYTLKAALGLAASEDDDGRAAGESDFPGDRKATPAPYQPPEGSITQDQADQIREALEAKGASRTAFLQWAGKKRIEDIAAEHFDSCIEAISKFRKVGK